MPRLTSHSTVIFAAMICVLTSGCGKKKKKDGDPAYAKFALANGTASLNVTDTTCASIPGSTDSSSPQKCWTPTYYGLKMLSVYVSPDSEGAKTAPGGLIWSNPACPTHTSNTEVGTGDDQKTYEYDVQDDCTDDAVSSYFDFARTSTAVNADLNSQDRKIPPGTYNYVQMAFCIGSAKSKNLQFKADGMTDNYSMSINKCGVVSDKLSDPIVLGEGESVDVSVTYDLSQILYQSGSYKDSSYCYISSDGSDVRCVSDFRSLKPSAKKR